jgi:outer membrane protein assembly factor BamA
MCRSVCVFWRDAAFSRCVLLTWHAPPVPLASDRFFLGGPDSLRGFCTKGAGPTDARRPVDPASAAADASTSAAAPLRDALGGDLLCTGAAAITFPVRPIAPCCTA